MIDMDDPRAMSAPGPFEARYLAFLETITNLRRHKERNFARTFGHKHTRT